jgi:hypothetical protein
MGLPSDNNDYSDIDSVQDNQLILEHDGVIMTDLYTLPSGLTSVVGLMKYIGDTVPIFYPLTLATIFIIMFLSQIDKGIIRSLLSSMSFTWLISVLFFYAKFINSYVVLTTSIMLATVIIYAIFNVRK